jgi:hypothetical protein
MIFYECKVFTPAFKAKLDAEIEKEVQQRCKEKNIPLDRQNYSAEFQRITTRDSFNFMWNHPEQFERYPEVKQYYESIGLWTPEYTIIKLEDCKEGLQSKERVMWNGKITKIDDIDEIFSFVRREEVLEL